MLFVFLCNRVPFSCVVQTVVSWVEERYGILVLKFSVNRNKFNIYNTGGIIVLKFAVNPIWFYIVNIGGVLVL